MIIDSHAHYSHNLYDGDFTYLDWQQGQFVIREGNRRSMLEEMKRRGICACLEAGVSLDKAPSQLEVARVHSDYLHCSLGIHPKHCAQLPPEALAQLEVLSTAHPILAIGETGLDYSMAPEQEERQTQKQWFIWQIELAHRLNMPLVLHIRDAYEDALEILRQHKSLLHGGVAHCFGSDAETAKELVEMGFALGIGARIFQEEQLQKAVTQVPLETLLVETDAPYIRPDIRHLPGSGKQRKKVRNSSLILPAVIEEIARLRGEVANRVEETIYRNTLRVFPGMKGGNSL